MKKTKSVNEESILKECFIITPIGSNGSAINREAMGIVEHIIKPLCEDLKFTKTISAADFATGRITTNIIKSIHDADLIVANLTEQNPNVMYELALAHAFKKKVVHILRKDSPVPFDVYDHKYIEYVNDVTGHSDLLKELRSAIDTAMEENENSLSNPVVDALRSFSVAEPQTSNVEIGDLMSIITTLSQKVDSLSIGQNESVYDTNSQKRYGASKKSIKNIANGYYSYYGGKLSKDEIINLAKKNHSDLDTRLISEEYLEIVEMNNLLPF